MHSKLKRGVLLVLPLAAAVAVFVLMVRGKQPPGQRGPQERALSVRTIQVPVVDFVPRAAGYGYIQPELAWDGVAEVEGKIVTMHPELKRGAIIPQGELLVRIDPAQRLTATEQTQADVQRLLASLEELEQNRVNLQRRLAVEQQSLTIAGRELARKRELVKQNVIAASEVDQEEKTYLTQKNAVQALENQLALIPPQERELHAQLAQARSRLTDARLNLEKTEVRAPFDGRLRETNVEMNQAVSPGQVLVRMDSMGVAEALAEIPLHVMRRVIPPRGPSPFAAGISMDALRRFLSLDAVVRLSIGGRQIEWPGRLVRFREEVDPKTRTIGAYVAVDNPYLNFVPGERPPLMRNTFCQVELRGAPRPDTVVLPRNAVRQGMVLLVDKDNRLRRVEVRLDTTQGEMAVVAEGLRGGEQVVVSDVPYAVDGMLLDVHRDLELERQLVEEAQADGGKDDNGKDNGGKEKQS